MFLEYCYHIYDPLKRNLDLSELQKFAVSNLNWIDTNNRYECYVTIMYLNRIDALNVLSKMDVYNAKTNQRFKKLTKDEELLYKTQMINSTCVII